MLTQRWFFSTVRLAFVLWLLAVMLACSQPKEDCKECTLGARKCSAGRDGVLICRAIKSIGCQKMVLERCPTGQECAVSGGRAVCQVSGSKCGVTCLDGQKRCEGENVAVCQREPISNCLQWFVVKTCLAQNPCDASTGDCSGTSGCTPKTLQHEKKCVGNAVYWFDDCGKQGKLDITCTSGKTCQKGICTGGNSGCQPKNLQAKQKCVGNQIYWFDDCNTQRDWVKTCQKGQTCQNSQCTGGGCQPNNPNHEKKCVGNAIYWFDDCGKQGTKLQDCVSPQTCSNGACQGGCNNQCQSGKAQCVGNSLQTCDRDAKGCYAWGQAFPCPAGQICQAGICVADGSGSGGGRSCKVGGLGTCKSDSDCCQGQTCISYVIAKGCGPCSSGSDCPKAGFLPLSCCQIAGKAVCALLCP